MPGRLSRTASAARAAWTRWSEKDGRPPRRTLPRSLRWTRPSRLTAGLTFSLASLMALNTAGSGMPAIDPVETVRSRHRAEAAPGQRWGSTADRGHLTPGQVNRTLPTSLRGEYPETSFGAPPKPHNTASRAKAERPAARAFDPARSTEIAAARTAHQRSYRNPDGSETTEVSVDPLHFRRPDGSWAPIDARLTPVPGGGWRNSADAVDVRLAPRGDAAELARIALDGSTTLAFGLAGAASAPGAADGDTVVYRGVRADTDLRLQAKPGGVKETVVLHSAAAPQTFAFPLRLSGLTAAVVDNQVVLTDKAGRQRAVIPAGFMQDAGMPETGRATSNGVRYELAQENGQPALKVSLDSAWLADPARRFPVEVDPTVGVPVDSDKPDSMYVHGNSWAANTDKLLVGHSGGANAAAYLRFDGLVGRMRNHTIYGAQLAVVQAGAPSCKPRPMTVHPVNDSWTTNGSQRYSWPGPAVGGAIASQSFAHGWIPVGQSSSPCPAAAELLDLGEAGTALVQDWVSGRKANNGLSLRAAANDGSAWKELAGSNTQNPPRLYVTHSPFNADYEIPNPVPDPPVLRNAAGEVRVTVTNKGAEAWGAADYYLAYRAFRVDTGEAVGQQRSAGLTGTVPVGGRATLTAKVGPLPKGLYYLDFTMVRNGGEVFTDHQVPPGRIVLEVFDVAPAPQEQYPPDGYQAPTLTPQLWARAVDLDALPNEQLQYRFQVCDSNDAGEPVNCTDSGWQPKGAWTVPTGRLSWSKNYKWRATVKDGSNEVDFPYATILGVVPQPEITSRIAAAPYGTKDKEYDAQVGNFTTAAVDASATTVSPELAVIRTYNSLDPRRDIDIKPNIRRDGNAFGAGWTTRFDMRLVPDDDGSGNVVITYPDGQQVRFGRNADGSYAAPPGRTASLRWEQLGVAWIWRLRDTSGTTYDFSGAGRLTTITDASYRSVRYTYEGGRLTRAQVFNNQSDQGGRSLRLTWTGPRVTAVTTDPVTGPDGTVAPLVWKYSYEGDRLTKVCAPGDACTSYSYGTGSHYRTLVQDAKPESYWRLGETQGTDAGSEIAVNLGKDAGKYTDVTLGAPGAVAGAGNTAVTFNGTSSTVVLPKGTVKKSRDVAIELWFKVPSTSAGGPLLGYQDQQLGKAPTAGVPIVYLDLDRRLRAQFAADKIAPILAPTPITDTGWHHVVLSAMGSTQTLYLDGQKVGELTGAEIDHSALTHNQIGAADVVNPGAWPRYGTTGRRYFGGSIDEVALYPHPLGKAAVEEHYALGIAGSDQVTAVRLPSGRVAASVEYDVKLDRVKNYTDRNGGTWKLGAPVTAGSATDLRRSVQVLDPANRPTLLEYDALAGRLLRSGTPLGLETREEDRPDRPTAPPSTTPPTKVCSQPDPQDPGFCTIRPGDSNAPIFVRHPLEGMAIRTYGYDKKGMQNVVTDENGDSVTMTFDARGNVSSRKTCRERDKCQTAYWKYPASAPDALDVRNNLPLEFRDARSSSDIDTQYLTTYEYLPSGLLRTQSNPGAGTVVHEYSNGRNAWGVDGGLVPPGLPTTSTDARNKKTEFAYFKNGDLAKVTAPSGLVTEYTYDALGRKTSEKEISDSFPDGVVTTFTYDAASRLRTVTEPATKDEIGNVRHQRRTTNTYDPDGNLTQVEVTDLLGGDQPRVTTFGYDEHGRPVKVTDAEGHESSTSYDRFGNKTSTVDGRGVRTDYAYTARNAVAEVRLRGWQGQRQPGLPKSVDYLVLHSYSYDYAGRMRSDTDAMGRRLEYEYYGDGLVRRIVLKDFHDQNTGATRDYVVEETQYDAVGNPVRKAAANGTRVTAYVLNRSGAIESVTTDPGGLGRRTAYEYDNNGNVVKTTKTGRPSNLPGFSTQQTSVVLADYDDAGRLKTETVVGNGNARYVTRYTYDKRGLLLSVADPRAETATDKLQFTSTFTYDEVGRKVKSTGPAVSAERNGGPAQAVNPTSVAGYNAFDERVAQRDALGNVTRMGYDRLGRPTTTTAPGYIPPGAMEAVTASTKKVYDEVGNVVQAVDAGDNVTRFAYDQLGRMVTRDTPSRTNDERALWRYTYTHTGEVLSVTDPTGARVETTYDDLDRQVTVTKVERKPVPDNFTTRMRYDDAGNLTRVVSPSGATLATVFDSVGAPIKTIHPSGAVGEIGYDFLGRRVRTVDGLGRASEKGYDAAGRVALESDIAPNGTTLRTQRYAYDPVGNLVSSTNQENRTTTYDYDAANRLVKQVEPVDAAKTITTTWGYDAAGNRTRYTDGRGNTTVYTVNSWGLPESVIEPATRTHGAAADRTWTVGYDARSLPRRLVAPGGVTRERDYDAAGRLTTETGTGAEVATSRRSLHYDAAGRLVGVDSPRGRNTYDYDDRGGMLTAAGPSGNAQFEYDKDGRLTKRADKAGTATYTYRDARLETMTDAVTRVTQTLKYDAAGQVKTVDYGAGRVRTFDYDDFGRLASDTLRNSGGQTVASVGYGYDLEDHLVRKTTTGTAGAGEETYEHDWTGRLTAWTGPNGRVEYGWDDASNRVKAGAKTATYDERNRLLSDGDYTYTYTARGTLQTRTSSGLPEPFSFDAFDRLVNGPGAAYTHDGLDRVDTRNGTAFEYSGSSDEVVADGVELFARGPADELLAVGQGDKKRLVLSNEHGDVVAGLDPTDSGAGAPADSTAYDPFGKVTARTGNTGSLGFQGDWTDAATGYVDMGARWYNPGTGVFVSRDSVNYGTGQSALANRYTYAAGDPVDAMDPDGHWPQWVRNVGGAIVSGAKAVGGAIVSGARAIGNAVVAGASAAWSAIQAVGNAISDGARWLYEKAKTVVNAVVSAVKWVGNKVVEGVKAAGNWAKARAQDIKAAAVRTAQAVTHAAKAAVSYAIKHNPLPALTAALKPVFSGLKTVVSAVASLPAKVVSTVRDVVKDAAKSVQVLYDKAVQAGGVLLDKVSNAVDAAANWVAEHKADIAGFLAGAVVGVGCGALIGWTGVGAVACGALAGVVGSVVHDMVEGGHGAKDMLTNAVLGGAIGGLTGGLFSVGGQALSRGAGSLIGGAGVRASAQAAGGAARAEASSIASGRITGGLLGKCNSFVGSTPVLMANGTTKAISDVRAGDWVLASDPTGDGEAKPRQVVDTIVGEGEKNLVEITVDTDGAGGDESGAVVATDGHEIWLQDERRWVAAKDVPVGALLRTSAGTYVQVTAIKRWTAPDQRVHNLTVDTDHTYYVMAGGTPVLVHNTGPLCGVHGGASGSPAGAGIVEGPAPAKALDMLDAVKNRAGGIGKVPGFEGNGSWGNKAGQLPGGAYREWDVNATADLPRCSVCGRPIRGGERLLTPKSGSGPAYYTPDHYGTFYYVGEYP